MPVFTRFLHAILFLGSPEHGEYELASLLVNVDAALMPSLKIRESVSYGPILVACRLADALAILRDIL